MRFAISSVILLAGLACFPSRASAQAQQPRNVGQTQYGQTQVDPRQAAGQNIAAQQPRPQAVQAPFQLTPEQQESLDAVLKRWEQRSGKITTFKCSFTRWEYDSTWGLKRPGHPDHGLIAKGIGEIKYKAPDHGAFRVREIEDLVQPTKEKPEQHHFVSRKEGLDHWVCDGTAVWEYKISEAEGKRKKELIEHRLPPEMRGKAIADGPLPFIFGAQADKLKRRYFMREITPSASAETQVWLEAWPRFQQDAANFQRVELILNIKDYMPYALQVYLPGGTLRHVYSFTDLSVDSPFASFSTDFLPPMTPIGWTKVIDDSQVRAQAKASKEPGQARGIFPFVRRK